jgi:hypothetical protein
MSSPPSAINIALQVHRSDIELVTQNGMQMQCRGLFNGQLVMKILPGNKSIYFAMMTSNPDFEHITSVFYHLASSAYPQCIFISSFLSFLHMCCCYFFIIIIFL